MRRFFGSFSKDKLYELYGANYVSGQIAHSISIFDGDGFVSVNKGKGVLNLDTLEFDEGTYCICYIQSSPNEEFQDRIHPVMVGDAMLWHNGKLNPGTITVLKDQFETTMDWDSHLLLCYMRENTTPKNIEGTFACFYYNPDYRALHLFRDVATLLYIDQDFNISTEAFDPSFMVLENTVFLFNPFAKELTPIAQFRGNYE